MNLVAFKILLHDKAKYVALVLGVSFATLLISQQSAIFHSLMHASTRDILEANQADIWVMKPSVETLDQGYPIAELSVNRVRSVPGVQWAVPYYQSTAQLRTEDGRMKDETCAIGGIDDLSMVGAPQEMLIGSLEDFNQRMRLSLTLLDTPTFFQAWSRLWVRQWRLVSAALSL